MSGQDGYEADERYALTDQGWEAALGLPSGAVGVLRGVDAAQPS